VTGRAWLVAACLALAAPLAAQAPLRPTQPDERPATGSDESELWYAMDQAELQLRQSPLLVRDQALNDYARKVMCQVTAGYCPNLRLYIVDLPWFNASMAPNGAMILWTGSLLRIRNEAQLALVLGHEFGHYRERHTLQQWRKAKKSSAFLGALGVLTSGAGMGVAGMAANLAGIAGLMKFTRDKEREADRVGLAQLQLGDYDARAGIELWEAMLREEAAHDYGKPLPVFSTHPRTRERLEDLQSATNALAHPGQRRGEAEYARATHPFLEHWLQGELTRRMYASSIVVIQDARKAAASTNAGLYSFFLAEAYRRRNKAGDREEAARLYSQSVTEPGTPAEAWREVGLQLRDAGQRPQAARALRTYLERSPHAADRAFIDSYLGELEPAP
jgi:predicted Zn-dependent protease